MTGWEEVGNGVFCRRYEPWDVTIGAVRGERGLLVVDTRAGPAQADELLADLRTLDPRAPAWVVNTHAHFDHTFGNGRFGGAEIWGHRSVPAAIRAGRHDAPDEPDFQAIALVPPDHLVVEHATLDLGDRAVDLAHLGHGHTDGDVVVWIPHATVMFAGDLVEESGPPAYGPDSFPLEWPAALERLAHWAAGAEVRFVPGHGTVVDRDFVVRQHRDITTAAHLLRGWWEDGTPAEEVVEAGGDRWPWPPSYLDDAVRRAYARLSETSGSGG